jgi:hypothetical protein
LPVLQEAVVGGVACWLFKIMVGFSEVRIIRRQAARLRGCAALLWLLPLHACALDSRDLLATQQSSAGSGVGGSANAAGASASTPGWDSPPPPDCVYVGRAVDPGCETLVTNPGFDQSADGWPPETLSVLVGWNEQDATASPASGSIAVDSTLYSTDVTTEGQVILGALQCVGATPGKVYDVRADVFIPEQNDEGRAGLSVLFYKTTNCNAGLAGTDLSFTSELLSAVGVWTPVSGRFVVPADVGSMEVELVVGKQFAPRSFKALFDNVLVQAK